MTDAKKSSALAVIDKLRCCSVNGAGCTCVSACLCSCNGCDCEKKPS